MYQEEVSRYLRMPASAKNWMCVRMCWYLLGLSVPLHVCCMSGACCRTESSRATILVQQMPIKVEWRNHRSIWFDVLNYMFARPSIYHETNALREIISLCAQEPCMISCQPRVQLGWTQSTLWSLHYILTWLFRDVYSHQWVPQYVWDSFWPLKTVEQGNSFQSQASHYCSGSNRHRTINRKYVLI